MRLNFTGFRLWRNLHWESGKKSLGAVRLNFAGFRRRYNSALKQCGTKGSAFVRFGALCCAGSPPPVRRASLQAARRVGAPRPEAQPARARPQAGARCCAAPEGQGGRRRLVTAARESSARARRTEETEIKFLCGMQARSEKPNAVSSPVRQKSSCAVRRRRAESGRRCAETDE